MILSFAILASLAPTLAEITLCMPGQCLQGFSNTTLGAVISAPSVASIQLLPGQYTNDTSPQLLHDLLTTSSASLSASPGFNGSLPLPLSLVLSPGLATFPSALYANSSTFIPLPSSPTPLTASKSLFLSQNISISLQSSSQSPITIWRSIPDLSQLPSPLNSSDLTLTEIQSTSCSPPCSSQSTCASSGICLCPPGFTGTSCERCLPGFFGPQCKKCPEGCDQCDEGIIGSGRCIKPAKASNDPSTCGCTNGACTPGGGCTCTAGFIKSDNGTQCSICANGFFLNSSRDCKVCQPGCTNCMSPSGACMACKLQFSKDPNDETKCNPLPSITSSGVVCPNGTFVNNSTESCTPCSLTCKTCTGPSANACISCPEGTYLFNGNCIGVDRDGVCQISKDRVKRSAVLVADNDRRLCDTCGSKCTSCKIPTFNASSTIDQARCTSCIPGFVLFDGKCVDSCPTGTLLDSRDNVTCTRCDTKCLTCATEPIFCLSCSNPNTTASSGTCISSCPTGTFLSSSLNNNTNTTSSRNPNSANATISSTKTCLPCHPDCHTCTNSSFTQCTSCPPTNPILKNGRCLKTCSQDEYASPDPEGGCIRCDDACGGGSCIGPGSDKCSSCGGDNEVLRGGRCVPAPCLAGEVVPGLGVCLSELVWEVGGSTSSGSLGGEGGGLEWWGILLIVVGCLGVVVGCGVWFWRRRVRGKEGEEKKDEQQQQQQEEGQQQVGGGGGGWVWIGYDDIENGRWDGWKAGFSRIREKVSTPWTWKMSQRGIGSGRGKSPKVDIHRISAPLNVRKVDLRELAMEEAHVRQRELQQEYPDESRSESLRRDQDEGAEGVRLVGAYTASASPSPWQGDASRLISPPPQSYSRSSRDRPGVRHNHHINNDNDQDPNLLIVPYDGHRARSGRTKSGSKSRSKSKSKPRSRTPSTNTIPPFSLYALTGEASTVPEPDKELATNWKDREPRSRFSGHTVSTNHAQAEFRDEAETVVEVEVMRWDGGEDVNGDGDDGGKKKVFWK